MLFALGASVTLAGPEGDRRVAVADLYRNDGIHYLMRKPTELLSAVHLPGGVWRSAYWKLRRRGAFDFPVLSAAAARTAGARWPVDEARIVLGAIASSPLEARRLPQRSSVSHSPMPRLLTRQTWRPNRRGRWTTPTSRSIGESASRANS